MDVRKVRPKCVLDPIATSLKLELQTSYSVGSEMKANVLPIFSVLGWNFYVRNATGAECMGQSKLHYHVCLIFAEKKLQAEIELSYGCSLVVVELLELTRYTHDFLFSDILSGLQNITLEQKRELKYVIILGRKYSV